MTLDQKRRLYDRILSAFQLALEQDDYEIAAALKGPLEMALTRNTGGAHFVEQRDVPPELARALQQFETMKLRQGD